MSLIGRSLCSPKKRSRAIVLREEGYTFQEIADKKGGGVTCSGVFKVCKKFLNFKTIKDLPGRGRKKLTTPQDDRQIVNGPSSSVKACRTIDSTGSRRPTPS